MLRQLVLQHSCLITTFIQKALSSPIIFKRFCNNFFQTALKLKNRTNEVRVKFPLKEFRHMQLPLKVEKLYRVKAK